MLLSDARFAVETSAKNIYSTVKRATSGVFRRVEQKLSHRDNGTLPELLSYPKYKEFYNIPDMFADADVYTSGIEQGMLRLFGSQSSIRSKIWAFLMDIVEKYNYNGNCSALAMQILDRFLTSTTAGHIKKRIYHYAFVSLMIAVEEVHGYIMLTKQFRRHVSKLCKNETIENYKQEVLKTLMGVVSVPTTNDLLIATLQIAAYEYPSVFGARDMLDQISEIRHKGLSLDPMPFLFNYSLIVDACKLAATVTTNRNCQGIAESMLASTCFYIIAENRFKLDTDKAGICARHSYEEVAGIVNYIKMII